jgi:hypothetical protein
MMSLTAELPDDNGLRGATFELRSSGDTLAAQAAVTRGVADGIGPGVWEDDASSRAKALLNELSSELSTGSSALHQSADALETLAQYVASQRGRYNEIGTQLEVQERDLFTDPMHASLGQATHLLEERRTIELNVSAAMSHARDVIIEAASRATRYHGNHGHSIWSRITHYVSDFASGAWDDTYGMGKAVFGLAVTAAKLSPERAIFDPEGYLHDAEHAVRTAESTVSAIVHHPGEFVQALLNLKELKSDPVHWAGELVPTIVLTVISAGAGAFGKGAEGAEVLGEAGLDVTKAATAESATLAAMSKTERLSYMADVVQQTAHLAPEVKDINVVSGLHFTPEAKFSFNAERLDHVTIGEPDKNGKGYSGGHLYHGFGGKPTFPANLNPKIIAENSYKVMEDPSSSWRPDPIHDGRFIVSGHIDSFKMQVVVEPYGKGLITSYPEVPGY